MTSELAAKARALSPDARAVVLDVADHGPGTYSEIAERTGLSLERVRKACRRLCQGPGYQTVRTTVEYGLGLYGRGRAMAEAVRATGEPRLAMEETPPTGAGMDCITSEHDRVVDALRDSQGDMLHPENFDLSPIGLAVRLLEHYKRRIHELETNSGGVTVEDRREIAAQRAVEGLEE